VHCDLTSRHTSCASPSPVVLRRNPIETYRNYRQALRSRDLAAILQNLAGQAAQRVLAFGDPDAFGPSLRVWCAMQAEAISNSFGIAINADRAIVQAGGKHTYCLLHMAHFDDTWRIVLEEHARRRRGGIAFESRSLDLFAGAGAGGRDGATPNLHDRRATMKFAHEAYALR